GENVGDPHGAWIHKKAGKMRGHSVGIPTAGAVKEDCIGDRAGYCADKPLAVAPKPVQLAQRIAPGVQFPGLERNPHYPARPLFDRGAQGTWEIAAGGDQIPVSPADGNEDLRASKLMETEAALIVFGQAFRFENAVPVRRCETIERPPGKAGADATGRQKSAEKLAGRHVLGLEF